MFILEHDKIDKISHKKDEELPNTNEEHDKEKQLQKEKEETVEDQPLKDLELDVTSEAFNPLKALYAIDYKVTQKAPKIIYQNMAAFETALKKVGIWNLNKRDDPLGASGSNVDLKKKNPFLVKEDSTQRRFQDHQLAIKTQSKVKNRHQRNIMTQMAQVEGPLKQLQQYVNDGKTVKVIIRKEHGIKGYVEGVLRMFDRHWNLLLTNVEECLEQRKYKYIDNKMICLQPAQDCCYILSQLGINLTKQTVKSLGRKRVEIRRHLPQVFLRGEHVVLVAAKAKS